MAIGKIRITHHYREKDASPSRDAFPVVNSIVTNGGADGPTSVLVASVTARYGVIAAAAIAVIVAIVGICKTKRHS